MTAVPELVPLGEGRWQGCCRFCKRESIPIPSVSAPAAWAVLSALGWVPYESVRGAMPMPLCKACGERNERIMANVKAAQKRRKRK